MSCPTGKVRQPDYASALAQVDTVVDGVTGLRSLAGSVYPCDSCSGFHVSSRRFTLAKPKGRGKRRKGMVRHTA